MSNFTYEKEERKEKLETWEWDSLWLEHPSDKETKRVLYIGDSISCGTRRIATAQTDSKIYFDGFGTSKGIDNSYFKDTLSLVGKQENRRDIVIFNNGLHGWHLSDDGEYGYYFDDMVNFLINEFPDTKVCIVLTTYVKDDERNQRVIKRNKTASAIAEKYSLPVIDLYSVSSQAPELLTEDGVHFSEEGYIAIAKKIIEDITPLFK